MKFSFGYFLNVKFNYDLINLIIEKHFELEKGKIK